MAGVYVQAVPTLLVPYFVDERLNAREMRLPTIAEVTAELPADVDVWHRLAVLYEQVARAVTAERSPHLVVVSGDCIASLGVLAGLQRAGHDPGIVWFDAHGDFHTEATTESGFLGGLPLALAAGVGNLALPEMLQLRPVPPPRVQLVGARDLDAPELRLLEDHAVPRIDRVEDLDEANLPEDELYLHLDIDVADPDDVPGLRYPAAGGPSLDGLLDALARVISTGRVIAVGLAATWRPGPGVDQRHQSLVRRVLELASAS
jgi:arginase